MEKLEFRFTPEQHAELSRQAVSIIETLRPHIFYSLGAIQNPEILRMSSLASTTALYETLGRDHPLFQDRYDLTIMHNTPSHRNVLAQDVARDPIQPDLFMSLAMTGPLGETLQSIEKAQTVPTWHQDRPKTKGDGAVISLYCVKPGEHSVATGFMGVEPIIDHFAKSGKNHEFSFDVTDDSRNRKLLHLPSYHIGAKLYDVVRETPFTDVHYDAGTMVFFRDKRVLHCTSLGYDPATNDLQGKLPKGRDIARNIFSDGGNLDFTSSPEAALATLRSAAAAEFKNLPERRV